VGHDGGDHDADDGARGGIDGAESARRRRRRVTDTNVALDGQQYRQPDRRRVENSRQVIVEALVQKAPPGWYPLGVATEHVEVDIARQRPDSGKRGGDGQSNEDDVGRTGAHVWFQQDDTDDAVSDDCKQNDRRRHITADNVHLRTRHPLKVERCRRRVLHRAVKHLIPSRS